MERRRSKRIETKKDTAGPGSPSKKFKEQANDLSLSMKNCELNEVESDSEYIEKEQITQPRELDSTNGVTGSEMYGMDTIKRISMMEKALKSRQQEQTMKQPKVVLDKLESNVSVDKKSKNTKGSSKIGLNPTISLSPRRTRSCAYHIKPDEYFAVQSEKHVTSNNTLSKLKNTQMDQHTLKKLLEKSDHIPKEHKNAIENLIWSSECQYIEWIQLMEEGFTVLLYGLGSKRLLINKFQKTMIEEEPALIINGFFPSLTLREILDNIIEELMGLKTSTNENECFEIIEKRMKQYPNEVIYLLIHNIDGTMLRANKAQDMLSRLAAIPNMHLLASVDHINAPLIWDNVMRARFNFYWVDATTFLPYEAETSYESSLLIKQSGTLVLQSLDSVFASSTKNAKSIYIHLTKYQLENSKNNYIGMQFKDLYRVSRENFWVNSDAALRSQLTEFLDHNLIKTKRHDGIEYFKIPLEDNLLKQLLEQYHAES